MIYACVQIISMINFTLIDVYSHDMSFCLLSPVTISKPNSKTCI